MTTGWVDACIFNATGTGTGDFVPNGAVQGYRTPASAGAISGRTYHYRAQNVGLTQWEIGSGIWNGTNLARTSIHASSSSDNKVNFSSVPVVMLVATSEDFVNGLAAAGSNTQVQYNNAGAFGGDANFTWTPGQGLRVKAANPTAGTITNAYGLIAASASAGSGAITNDYGLYVEDQANIGGTRSINLFSAGLGGNQLEGLVHIGPTAYGIVAKTGLKQTVVLGPGDPGEAITTNDHVQLGISDFISEDLHGVQAAGLRIGTAFRNTSVTASGNLYGIDCQPCDVSQNTGPIGGLWGIFSQPVHYGQTGTMTTLRNAMGLQNYAAVSGWCVGLNAYCTQSTSLTWPGPVSPSTAALKAIYAGNNIFSGTATDVFGVDVYANLAGGTVTNARGIYIRTPSTGATITNNHGLYIDPQAGIGGTTSYNILSRDSASLRTPASTLGGNLLQGRVAMGNYADIGKWTYPPGEVAGSVTTENEPVPFLINHFFEGDFSAGTGNERDGMVVYLNFKSNGGGGTAVGMDIEANIDSRSLAMGGVTCMRTYADTRSANSISSILGTVSEAQNNGSGTVFAIQAHNSIVTNAGSALVTNIRNIGIFTTNSGTATNCFGIYLNPVSNTGTITNAYGIQIGDWSGKGGTISYNIHSVGSASLNILEGWVQQGAGFKRVATQFDKASSASLSNITGLSATVKAGRTYEFEAVLFTTSDVANGVQAAIAGTATATAIVYEGWLVNGNTVAGQTRATALATAVAAVTAVTAAKIIIRGLITVNAAGTLTVQFAQNSSGVTASSVLVGSYFLVRDLA